MSALGYMKYIQRLNPQALNPQALLAAKSASLQDELREQRLKYLAEKCAESKSDPEKKEEEEDITKIRYNPISFAYMDYKKDLQRAFSPFCCNNISGVYIIYENKQNEKCNIFCPICRKITNTEIKYKKTKILYLDGATLLSFQKYKDYTENLKKYKYFNLHDHEDSKFLDVLYLGFKNKIGSPSLDQLKAYYMELNAYHFKFHFLLKIILTKKQNKFERIFV